MMTEMTLGRRVGQLIFLLGLLAWGFGISYAEAGVAERANLLFAAGTVVMLVGMYVIRRVASRHQEE